MRELKQLQRERKAQQQRQQPKQTVQAAKPDIPIPVNNPPPLSWTAGPPRHNGYATPAPVRQARGPITQHTSPPTHFRSNHLGFDRSGSGRVTGIAPQHPDRKSTRLNSSHLGISYAV